jgi:hypothetical protein
VKKAETKAIEKARAFYGNDDLVTIPFPIEVDENSALVEIGEVTAIEYKSKKWDGKTRIFRHDVTKRRKLYISTDGTLLVVVPGFKLTKRGIEG